MKLNLIVLMLLVVPGGQAADSRSEFATGRAYYTAGEFKRAVAHFRLALKTNPNDADSYYWMGMSYQVLGDIAVPFDSKYNSKARICLTRALDLAPGRPDYRRALFDFLLDTAASSRAALRQAVGVLLLVSESDPDYSDMRRRIEDESRAKSSAEARLGKLFLAVPRAAYRIVELPASALSRPD